MMSSEKGCMGVCYLCFWKKNNIHIQGKEISVSHSEVPANRWCLDCSAAAVCSTSIPRWMPKYNDGSV